MEKPVVTMDLVEQNGISQDLITLIEQDLDKEWDEWNSDKEIFSPEFFSHLIRTACNLTAVKLHTEQYSKFIEKYFKYNFKGRQKEYFLIQLFTYLPHAYREDFYDSYADFIATCKEIFPCLKMVHTLHKNISKEFYGDHFTNYPSVVWAYSHLIKGITIYISECDKIIDQKFTISKNYFSKSPYTIYFPETEVQTSFANKAEILQECYRRIQIKQEEVSKKLKKDL